MEYLLDFSVRKSGANAPVTLNIQRQLDELAQRAGKAPPKYQRYTVGLH